ncbi:hypothetical protein F5890DRAFT_1556856 [Lentinula detonsa]|uniref:Uncharacterized protein n=1 Tax=Lentinula detonsa TaxID=2804962 RepID=A0AA38PTL2_9AGAR|nr:hypothetical protein F5890DRAFT_1556856 [Lentinula detonsa]
MNLASIPSTTATTCPFKDATLPNHSGSTSSSSKEASVKTKDQHEKRARSLKLYRLECFEKLVDAVQDPAKTVIPGPTSFSYLGGLDMTPDPETAEAWGLYELQLRGACPVMLASQIETQHRFVLIEYTLRDSRSELVTLDLDELQKNQAALRRMVPSGVPVPSDLVTWVSIRGFPSPFEAWIYYTDLSTSPSLAWHTQSDSLVHHAPTPYNSWMDQQYNHADILSGSIPTGDWAHVIPGIGSKYKQYVLKSPRCKFTRSLFLP